MFITHVSVGYFVLLVNRRMLEMRLISNLYFKFTRTHRRIKQIKQPKNFNSSSFIRFRWTSMFAGIVSLCRSKRNMKDADILYQKGRQMVQTDLNVVNLVQQIKKIKTALAFLIQERRFEVINNVIERYQEN